LKFYRRIKIKDFARVFKTGSQISNLLSNLQKQKINNAETRTKSADVYPRFVRAFAALVKKIKI